MKFSPESRMMSSSETRLSESQEALYPLLVPENEKNAMNMDDFRDLYDVDRDLEYVHMKEAEFARRDIQENNPERARARKGGKLFEALTNYGINEIGFLGADTSSVPASRYDDIRGIDSIVEFESEEGMTSHIALAIDVTRNPHDVKEKFDNVRRSIDSGKLSEAKYFKSSNFRGELSNIVRVIVGADQPTIDSISDLIVRNIRLNKAIDANKKLQIQSESAQQLIQERGKVQSTLGEHQLQWIVLLEIQQQLKASRKRADEKRKSDVVRECDKILNIIDDVIKDKKAVGLSPDEEALLNDRVYQLIQQEIKLF